MAEPFDQRGNPEQEQQQEDQQQEVVQCQQQMSSLNLEEEPSQEASVDVTAEGTKTGSSVEIETGP